MAMQVKTESPVFEPGIAKPLFAVRLETTARCSRYQSASNGKRFLVNLPVQSSSPITIAINTERQAKGALSLVFLLITALFCLSRQSFRP
jgi:hypothetical protein